MLLLLFYRRDWSNGLLRVGFPLSLFESDMTRKVMRCAPLHSTSAEMMEGGYRVPLMIRATFFCYITLLLFLISLSLYLNHAHTHSLTKIHCADPLLSFTHTLYFSRKRIARERGLLYLTLPSLSLSLPPSLLQSSYTFFFVLSSSAAVLWISSCILIYLL